VRVGSVLFERILDADKAVLVLETSQPEVLIEQFRQLVRRSGQTAYLWREGEGLHSLREGGVQIPGCLRASDTLRYAYKNVRFGIYLLTGLKPPLRGTQLTLLRRIDQARVDVVRRVVLFSDGPALAESLGDLAMALRHREVASLRLRDGRWVR
jgi:hypothetical protein